VGGCVPGAIKDHRVDELTLAEYLLFLWNKARSTAYVHPCGLAAPTADVTVLMAAVARRYGLLRPGGGLDESASARAVLQLYRRGALGRFTLDDLTPAAVAAFFGRPWPPPTPP
jgi:mitochondrial GTPase 1